MGPREPYLYVCTETSPSHGLPLTSDRLKSKGVDGAAFCFQEACGVSQSVSPWLFCAAQHPGHPTINLSELGFQLLSKEAGGPLWACSVGAELSTHLHVNGLLFSFSSAS